MKKNKKKNAYICIYIYICIFEKECVYVCIYIYIYIYPPASARDVRNVGSVPRSQTSSGGGHGNPH